MSIFLASNHFGVERAGEKMIPMETEDFFFILGSCVVMGFIVLFLPKSNRSKTGD
jgi:hypothetical protein